MKKELILRDKQEEIVEQVVLNIENERLYEAPTAFGKTHTILAAATRLSNTKKVIISTISNKLAKDMINTFNEYNFDSKKTIALVLGKSNYIDKERLLVLEENKELFEFIYEDSYDIWKSEYFKKDVKELFIDDFINTVDLLDQQYEKTIVGMIAYSTKQEFMGDFESADIIVTNHFYFLYRVGMAKSLEPEEYYVLFDEVHEIPNVAEATFQSTFSPFQIKNMLNVLLKDENLIKNKNANVLKQARGTLTEMINASVGAAKNNIGEYICSGMLYANLLEHLDAVSNNKKKLLDILDTIKYEDNLKVEAAVQSTRKEYRELASVLNAKNAKSGELSIYLSPSKGYPSFKATMSELSAKLHFDLWEKLGAFAGFSATLLPGSEKVEKNIRYAYTRLGKNFDKTLHKVVKIDRVLPKENVNIVMPKFEFIDAENKENEEAHTQWLEFVISFIKLHHNNLNTIVFAGGYQECHTLANKLSEVLSDTHIDYAKPSNSASQTIKEFEKRGGILVATRNYMTGISLKGKLLENVFLLKCPYPVFTSKRWLDLRYKKGEEKIFWYLYTNEMLLTLRQALGRVQRDFEDKGNIYLLDSRIFDRKKNDGSYKITSLVKSLFEISEDYGVVEHNPFAKKKKTLNAKEKNDKGIDDLMDMF